jgi:uncharacterized protein YndB with AHSA1/START domain
MKDLILERSFPADIETVFAYLTKTEHLLRWWGPEGITLSETALDFSRLGAWTSTMVNPEGGKHKVSGEVVSVDPPNSVELTWAWHNEDDARGHDSLVRFECTSNAKGGTDFTLIHAGLADEESAENHNMGWTSSLRKLTEIAT